MEYEIRQTLFDTKGELQQLVELQNYVYAFRHLRFSIEGFRKWYKENPLGDVLSYSAFDGDKMIAHYACIPTQMLIDGRVVKGVHSMAVVTHPDYRGNGLFRTLADMTYKLAATQAYEFVVGVSNANSHPGFMKYFPYTFIGQLDVKWGWGPVEIPEKLFSKLWDEDSIKWRLSIRPYTIDKHTIYGSYGKYPFIKTLMGNVPSLNDSYAIQCKKPSLFRLLNLYVGIGADLSRGHYFNMPSFVHHSPFNLRFMDITPDKHLPGVNRDNIVFQLIDFDVA